jgi:hypothetical protein
MKLSFGDFVRQLLVSVAAGHCVYGSIEVKQADRPALLPRRAPPKQKPES